jgi:hypothetical protein
MKHTYFYIVEIMAEGGSSCQLQFDYLHDALALCKALDQSRDKVFYRVYNMSK